MNAQPRVIWGQADNPTPWVAEQLGIPRWQLRERIHDIKNDAGLGAADLITIYDDGTVKDANGDEIGNILD